MAHALYMKQRVTRANQPVRVVIIISSLLGTGITTNIKTPPGVNISRYSQLVPPGNPGLLSVGHGLLGGVPGLSEVLQYEVPGYLHGTTS